MTGKLTRRAALHGGVAVLAAMFGASACRTRPSTELRMAAGEPGGFFWEFAGLIAAAADRTSALRIQPLQSAGSIDNLNSLASREAELALSLSDAAYDRADQDDLTAVGCVYENYFQIAVRADSPIASVHDLRGRTVSIGAPGSGAAPLSARVLAAAGLSAPGDTIQSQQSMREAARALAEGGIDAAMWAGGLPTPAFAELAGDIRLLDLTSVIRSLRASYGATYEAVSVRAGTYGAHAAVKTVGVANLLLVRRDIGDEPVAALVDLLLGDPSQLIPEQAVGSQFLDAPSLIQTGAVPLHPGAIQAYRNHHG